MDRSEVWALELANPLSKHQGPNPHQPQASHQGGFSAAHIGYLWPGLTTALVGAARLYRHGAPQKPPGLHHFSSSYPFRYPCAEHLGTSCLLPILVAAVLPGSPIRREPQDLPGLYLLQLQLSCQGSCMESPGTAARYAHFSSDHRTSTSAQDAQPMPDTVPASWPKSPCAQSTQG